MPTLGVKKELLFKALGQTYSDEEFADLCFDFGLELDEVTTEKQMISREQGVVQSHGASEEIIYRIDIPANRYDLLCLEGLVSNLLVFLGKQLPPEYLVLPPLETMQCKPDIKKIRPYVVAAILRDLTFNQHTLDSFIDLQDKLHQNICRKRSLVAIGTHDLDTIKGPFTYDALPPSQIKFKPLNQSKEYTGVELMELYSTHAQLKQYLPIIKDSPVYPVITDSNGVVLSLPPIINGDHSKITVNTKNVFIECTAVDLNKAEIVLDTLVCMFSQYCKKKYTVERCTVKQVNGTSNDYPIMTQRKITIDMDNANKIIGIKEPYENIRKLFLKMGLKPKESKKTNSPKLSLFIPPTRHDVIHEMDVLEDLGIAFGYNNIVKTVPRTFTIGQEFDLNKLSDHLRHEVARCGFTEALTFTLCSTEDVSTKLQKTLDAVEAVHISNPKTLEFQVCRTELLPCLLKTLAANKKMPLPLRIFEVSDVVLRDNKTEVGARNERHFSAVYQGKTSGFEIIHGLLDRVMLALDIKSDVNKVGVGYHLRPNNGMSKGRRHPTFFPKRGAEVLYNGVVVGKLGILHPQVVKEFDLSLPCSALELNIEPFL